MTCVSFSPFPCSPNNTSTTRSRNTQTSGGLWKNSGKKEVDKWSLFAKFLRWHYKLNHLSPAKMKTMKMISTSVSTCLACKFGKAMHRAWRNKPATGHQGGKLWVATRPGECRSVDRLEFTTPGIIAQVKGTLPQWNIVRQPFLWTMVLYGEK